MLYELRIYHVNPGKMQALHERFRDHVIDLFSKHGMKITHYWEAIHELNNRLYYVEHDNMESRNLNYERFRNDPEWIEVKRISEMYGPLLNNQESIFMKNAAFSRTNKTGQ
ncbi:NIPSNAP family containing protein [Paenibacillus sp. Soil766]|uniref:NIPSNAP family protein n=1 Tax=Paenibacillus sp. Soil766 TaxID=1736404 RepID=UPI00070D3948|nr:NIPSNAP family protein [Paenibacillus sp. Soil766]KRF04854.1 NIPSNAP family containing protein [Paenibacillus sp. Soil766]